MDGNKNVIGCDEEQIEDGFVLVPGGSDGLEEESLASDNEQPQSGVDETQEVATDANTASATANNAKPIAEATEQNNKESIELEEEEEGWYKKYTRWSPTSPSLLAKSEKQILSYVKTPSRGFYVDIGKEEVIQPSPGTSSSSKQSEERKIWTVVFNEIKLKDGTVPLVMVHGLCASIGLWSINIDDLSKDRAVYTIDLLGFGRSSRPKFSLKPEEAEMQHVEALEAWTRELGLNNFILLGHSMGGFISASYGLKYPEKIAHLICADPWGFTRRSEDSEANFRNLVKHNMKLRILTTVGHRLNPLAAVRAAGPMGPSLILKARPDLMIKFDCLNKNGQATVAEYIFHCNAQKPTGEEAFRTMMDSYGWAKNPMYERIHLLDAKVRLTIIYGGNSWIKRISCEEFQQTRPEGAFTEVHVIPLAGHHVYVDDKESFNQIVNTVGEQTDKMSSS